MQIKYLININFSVLKIETSKIKLLKNITKFCFGISPRKIELICIIMKYNSHGL